MKTYAVSIDVRIRRKHGKKVKNLSWEEALWCALYELRETRATAAALRLFHLLEEIYYWFDKEARIDPVTKFPPHNLFCECRRCQPSFTSYWRHLKKDLQWKKDGHLAR